MLVLIGTASLLTYCSVTYHLTKNRTRKWESMRVLYDMSIKTVPPNSKIYINQKYVGTSPLRHRLEISDLDVYQDGTQPYDQKVDDLFGKLPPKNFGPITWDGDLYPFFNDIQVDIQAFKDGYQYASETVKVVDSDNNILIAFRSIRPNSEGRIPYSVTVSDDILIKLYPNPESTRRKGDEQQQQQQQQTVVVPDAGSESQTESGLVMLTSIPEDADVYVDGIFVSNSPANLKMKDGIHIIEVRKQGYKNYRKEIRVFSGSEVTLRIILDEE